MESFETYRPLMFSIAYRMLGSVMEAEDIVQEAYLRYQAAPAESIRSLKGFLTTVVTRLCLDQLTSARAQRETYLGPWLPEPILTAGGAPFAAPMSRVMDYESISMAFLVLLESLTPPERAVFLLREVFDFDYGEIAGIIGKEDTACRQLFSRAKKRIAEHRPRFRASPEEHNEMLGRFMQAVGAGDLDGLMSLLSENVTSWADGGGKVSAATRPVRGRDNVARYFLGLARRAPAEMTFGVAEVNGKLALIARIGQRPYLVLSLEVADGLIRDIFVLVNPDKLTHLY